MRKRFRLTPEEKKAIQALKELELDWPESLWLFSAAGELYVMRKRDGERVTTGYGGMDQGYIVARIEIENDGGDW